MNKGLRLAALRLATLHPADRRWLLEQLSVEQQEQLREGIDRLCGYEPALLRDALEQAMNEDRGDAQDAPNNTQAEVEALLGRKDLPARLADALNALKDGNDFESRVRSAPVIAMETLAE